MDMVVNNKTKISLDEPLLLGNERKYLNQCIETNWISWQGEFVRQTEELLADYCSTNYCLTIVNGTYALVLALQSLGVGPGDDVIVPTLTMSATAFAVTTTGANVVWVDSEKDSFTISPEDVKEKITAKTKAIMVVHLYGRPVNMDDIMEIANAKGISVIEDVAEGLGTTIQDKKVGGLGTIACHSFHNKIVASGEGGAITLNDKDLYDKINELRTPPPDNSGSNIIALNNRMSNIACAVALAQLERIEELIKERRRVARSYDKLLGDVTGIRILPENENERCAYWRYQIWLTDKYPISKEKLITILKEHNIESRAVFTLMSDHPYYKHLSSGNYPHAEEISRRCIDIPSSPNLREDQLQRISNIIKSPK
jgi:perosamine synthetase